jgi:peroxiredoxin
MSTSQLERTLQPGDVAPNVVLDAITRQGKVAVDDYRGRTPVLIGIFRGLHCPYCRRDIAALAHGTGAAEKWLTC